MSSLKFKNKKPVDFTKGMIVEHINFRDLTILICPNETEDEAHETQFFGVCIFPGNTMYRVGHLYLFNRSEFTKCNDEIRLQNTEN